jgi:hypothetical protein
MRLTENCLLVIVDIRFRSALGLHPSRSAVVFMTSIIEKTTPHVMPI